jgi:histidine triad (HIT) family protein
MHCLKFVILHHQILAYNELMSDDVFRRIINKELPSSAIYEDDKFYAFLDINPTNPGHTLIVPKTKYANIYEMPDEMLSEMMPLIKKVAIGVKEGVSADGINIINNNERAAGQVVFHYHVHVIPRFDKDSLPPWPHTEYKEGQMEEVRKKIASAIKKTK